MGKLSKYEEDLRIKLTEGTEDKVLTVNSKKALAGFNRLLDRRHALLIWIWRLRQQRKF